MNNQYIISKIKEQAYENVNKKIEEERKRTENKISYELEHVSKCLKYITNKMVYKIIGNSWSAKEYVLADESMFLEDYNKEPKYSFEKGIRFRQDDAGKYESLFKVNGECYYDIRYIIRNYEERFNDYSRKLNKLRDEFNEIENAAERLKKQEPHIKKLIEQYNKLEIDEVEQ